MAFVLGKFSSNLSPKCNSALINFIRNGHHLRGKPPGVARSLKQRLQEINYKDPSLHFRVDIGLPAPAVSRSKQLQERLKVLKALRKNPDLEKLARNKKLLIDLEEANNVWLKTSGLYHVKAIADHYGVFEHLFGDAYFLPVVSLKLYFNKDNVQHPVYYGNVIKPADASNKPEVHYESDDKTLWTLIMTNPDGHFTQQDKEYVHWFVGNIPGNKIEKGETIVDYLQPIPPKGTGYHRHIFILYKQEKKLDFSDFKKPGKCLNLEDRTFSTLDFYRERQDDLTPGGLAFFQADWDRSLTDFYHNTLNVKEPIFEYDFPGPYIRPQEWFAKRRPFNLYMDKYRDPKQINKEFLMRKLKNVHPFKAPPPPLPFPNAIYFEGYVPSWLKLEKQKSRMKWGRINDIE
ncbi:large ribosomal subunit protein mL38 [Tribolium castaneum]|uniref:Large ribosomal subunit protein mL38 n=1 Tax=Tribolium castaneum TaxID=7070 RepID=D6WGV2_TRICA|nr:PREDICTED: 39S ribosomal protein L38, mitochondrial [Tribolium castaneum]EEZ99758.1 39S ribosomal protein L38, mitochondrial-like Protein [Tribolium castaneum]|eukprot:XP_967732.1 PREDICTED: 39S ribosomal protein L38, mitochondrial [Tribolium castaneum]